MAIQDKGQERFSASAIDKKYPMSSGFFFVGRDQFRVEQCAFPPSLSVLARDDGDVWDELRLGMYLPRVVGQQAEWGTIGRKVPGFPKERKEKTHTEQTEVDKKGALRLDFRSVSSGI